MNNNSQKTNFLFSKFKHDLKNPINAMIGYSEFIIEEIESDDYIIHISDVNSIYSSCKDIYNRLEKSFVALEKINFIEQSDLDFFHYEIRTSLCSVIGLIELINEKNKDAGDSSRTEFSDCIDNIYTSCKTMLQIIEKTNNYFKENIEQVVEENYDDATSNKLIKLKKYQGKILIIDDDITNSKLLEKILKKLDHETEIANNGSSALSLIKNDKFDLILLDIIMPDINGIEMLQKIKENDNYYDTPIIMLTALDDLESIVDCINLGATDYITKPIDKILLNARINNCLEKKSYRDKERKYIERIKKEEKKTNTLLLNIMPENIADRLKEGEKNIADRYENVTVLFADISGFTKYSSEIAPKIIVEELNNIFSFFDDLVDKYNVEKIKTIGDNYMIASGLPDNNDNHAQDIIKLAIDMHNELPKIDKNLSLKIGINSGEVVAGVIGKRKFIYDLWGDTVNVASRMEMYGENDKIHVSANTYNLVKDKFKFSRKNTIDIKGKGKMDTYFLDI